MSIVHFHYANTEHYEILCGAIDRRECDPNMTDDEGKTLWHRLAGSGNYEALSDVIDTKRCDPSIRNKHGYTIWYYLAFSGNKKALCKAYEKYKFNIDEISSKYHYLLQKTEIGLLAYKSDNIQLPDDFRCPVSGNLIIDPVITENGYLYDRLYIEKWLEKSDIDPLSGTQLTTKKLFPDLRTKRDILKWLKSL